MSSVGRQPKSREVTTIEALVQNGQLHSDETVSFFEGDNESRSTWHRQTRLPQDEIGTPWNRHPAVMRSSILSATSSQTIANSSNSCLISGSSACSACCRYFRVRLEDNHRSSYKALNFNYLVSMRKRKEGGCRIMSLPKTHVLGPLQLQDFTRCGGR
jgi:hypothetical protein